MGVTHIRYLLNQWRLRWETVAAVHDLEREKPVSSTAPSASLKDCGEEKSDRSPAPRGK
jgi:hypothetical protein